MSKFFKQNSKIVQLVLYLIQFMLKYPIFNFLGLLLALSQVCCIYDGRQLPQKQVKQNIVSSRSQILQLQLTQLFKQIRGKSIAILTNPTAVDGSQRLIFQRILQNSKQYNFTIKCFFAPEHGLRGDRQAGSGDTDYVDQQTGIIVYSLYGVRKAPQRYQLSNVDVLLYDIQDVGTRFYTYIWTLTYTIQVLSQLSIPLIIFDRPNPLGRKVQGCPLLIDAGMIGRLLPKQKYSIPQRYGLTIGQFIGFIRQYLPANFSYKVIKMSSWYQIKQQEWILSSPNMPTIGTALVYPGMGMFQGTSISEGRGTTKPFQLSGIPNITANSILKYFETNNITVQGAILREAYFIPTFSKHIGQICAGVQIHVINETDFNPVLNSMNLMKAYLSLNPNISVSQSIDKMFGFSGFRSMIVGNYTVDSIRNQYKYYENLYKQNYNKYWLYGSI